MKQFVAPFLEIFELLVIVFVSLYVIYAFIAQPFEVQGASMEPTFKSGDYILIDEISYRFRVPERGEVVVFRNPNNKSEYFIKRVIGLPGDEIIISDGRLLINRKEAKESYLLAGAKLTGEYYFKLGEEEYFVMGDNRPQSFDSRSWGPLEHREVVGMVRLRFWPPSEVAAFSY